MPFDRRFALGEDPVVKAINGSDLRVPAHGTQMVRVHELVTSDGLDPHASPEALELYRRRIESGDAGMILFEGRPYHSRLEGAYRRVTAEAFRNEFAGTFDDDEEVYGVYVYSARSEELKMPAFREVSDVTGDVREGRLQLLFADGETLGVPANYPLYALMEDRRRTRPPS